MSPWLQVERSRRCEVQCKCLRRQNTECEDLALPARWDVLRRRAAAAGPRLNVPDTVDFNLGMDDRLADESHGPRPSIPKLHLKWQRLSRNHRQGAVRNR